MKKKTIIIATVAILLVLAIAVCVIPIPMKFQPTIQAIKLDNEGNQLGTVELQLDGWVTRSLFRKHLWSLTILPFEDYPKAKVNISNVSEDILGGYQKTSFVIAAITQEMFSEGGDGNAYGFHVAYTDDLEFWCIRVDTDETPGYYYLGSASGQASTEELMEIFHYRLPQ